MLSVELNTGAKIPAIGLGTWQMPGPVCYQAVRAALAAGYRHIDTAKLYGNEDEVGRAIKVSGLERGQVFITTKLWPTDFGDPSRALDISLKRLGLDYVDLYLIHWPRLSAETKVWQQLEQAHRQGLAKAIGVSNYGRRHLAKLLEAAEIKPAVNQIEITPFHFNASLTAYCQQQGIAIEAYSPLGRGNILDLKPLPELAAKYHKSAAQLLLRWNIQHGFIALPKSAHAGRITENFDIFDFKIDAADMQKLDSLSGKA